MTATPLSSRRWLTKGTSELRRDARLSGDGRYGCDGDLGCICTTMCAGHGRGGWTTMQPSASIICREEGDVAAWASVSASRSLRAVPWAKPRHMTNMTTRKVVKPPIRIIATSASRRLAFWGPGLLGRGVGRQDGCTDGTVSFGGYKFKFTQFAKVLSVKFCNLDLLLPRLYLTPPVQNKFWNPRARATRPRSSDTRAYKPLCMGMLPCSVPLRARPIKPHSYRVVRRRPACTSRVRVPSLRRRPLRRPPDPQPPRPCSPCR